MRADDLIDELIEECSGDIHGALRVLLAINERLEAELLLAYRLSSATRPHRPTVH